MATHLYAGYTLSPVAERQRCIECGADHIEVWSETPGPDGSLTVSYWCPDCAGHRTHTLPADGVAALAAGGAWHCSCSGPYCDDACDGGYIFPPQIA